MTNWFYFLAVGITLIFIICFFIIFFCTLKILSNVEQTLIKSKRKNDNEWCNADNYVDFDLAIAAHVDGYSKWGNCILAKAQQGFS